ncbi:MAG TPA: transcription antitermination factor NusB [Micromonosporaceae bacterium]|nr:transcription antitermination factor NusB [Micromonosporaceae bacterium]
MTNEPRQRIVPARRKARKRAVDVLYESEMRGAAPLEILRDRIARAEPPISPYTRTLVEGVVERQTRIDELISGYATDWTLERMPPVDRNILRIAVYELLWCDDIDMPVAISEAVELAKSLSTDDSPRFVNGLLGRLAEHTAQ